MLKLAGVAGWPVHHSISPFLHNLWLKAAGLQGAYTMFAVHPDEAEYAFKTLKRTTITGLNVTMPLKGFAFKAADECTPDAQKLGVCNVLYKRGDKLIGHNTDMEGFAAPLLENIGHQFLLNNTVTLVGAGGAGRAVLGSLLALGAPEVRILNRTDARAKALVDHVNIPSLYAEQWANRQNIIEQTGILINASSAGMHGLPPLDVDVSKMPEGSWIYDLVYAPIETPLIVAAQKHGLKTIGGLDMLIAQARPSFKLFYGVDAPKDLNGLDVKSHLIKHLAEQAKKP